MLSYKRKITYFYEHHNQNVGTTAGFLKLEIRGDKVKILINIQEPAGLPYQEAGLYFYHEAGDHLVAVKVENLTSTNGMLAYQNRTEWQNMYGTNRDLYTFDGVAVVYNETHYYIGDFSGKNRREYPLVFKQEQPKQEKSETLNQSQPGEILQDKPTRRPVAVQRPEKKREEASPEQQENKNAFEDMIARYPKLPMYGAAELFDCVRIHPKDIGKLDMRNWKLGVNSFLTHGFYTYQYLLLGKMRFDNGKESPIIGVPGVYSNRERYLANMFGFEQFIPIKKTGTKTGQFGYWIVELL